MLRKKYIGIPSTLVLLCCLLLAGCNRKDATWNRGAYYWRTAYQLTPGQKSYIDSTHTDRLYIKFFDVDVVDNEPVPIATTRFLEDCPGDVEIVPTVYIVNQVLRRSVDNPDFEPGKPDVLAGRIVTRVLNMVSYNEIPNVREVQLDCDWTLFTEPAFFDLCREARRLLREKDIKLSVTLRLWQLNREAPPVDRVMLMLYNTGDFSSVNTKNSILDIDDVRPYFKDRVRYSLPVDIALPRFEWTLCYNPDGSFNCILKNDEPPQGCIVRHESVTPQQIAEVLNLVELQLKTPNRHPKKTYFSL